MSTLLEAEVIPAGVAGESGDIWRGEPFTSDQVISDPFGIPRNNSFGYHLAPDFVPTGKREIRFARSIRVIQVLTWHEGDDRRTTNAGYGNVLFIEDTMETVRWRVAHCASFGPKVTNWIAKGTNPSQAPILDAGELLAIQGNTGYVFSGGTLPPAGDTEWGLHTHLEELRFINGAWVYVNPLRYVTGASPVLDLPPKEPIPDARPRDYIDEIKIQRMLLAQLRNDPSVTPDQIYDAIDRELAELLKALGG